MLANLDTRPRQMGMTDQARLQILAQLGGQANAQATRPGFGDQVLAGGAGMFALGATQNAQGRATAGAAGPGGGGRMSPTPTPSPVGSYQPGNDYFG